MCKHNSLFVPQNLEEVSTAEGWRVDDLENEFGRNAMSLSRRHFVHMASLSLVTGAVLPAAFAQDAPEGVDETFSPERMAIFQGISMQTFKPYLMDRFAISLAGRPLGKLTLIDVSDTHPGAPEPEMQRGNSPARPQQRALTGFALQFQGSGGRLPQETYTFSQAALGKFPLFLVPDGHKPDPPTYTAIFTLLATPEPIRTEP
jgi:hypothetical protein